MLTPALREEVTPAVRLPQNHTLIRLPWSQWLLSRRRPWTKGPASSLSNLLQWETSSSVGSWAFCGEDAPELFWRASRKMQNKIQSIKNTGRWLSCWIRCSRQRTGSGRAEELKKKPAELGKKNSALEIQFNKYIGDEVEKVEAGI